MQYNNVDWSPAQFQCGWNAENELSLEKLVDSWHFLFCYGGWVLTNHLYGSHSPLLPRLGHSAQVLSRDHFHRLLKV